MRYCKIFIFLIILFPYIVLAEECDISKITITSIEQKGIEGNTEQLDDPDAKDRNIKLNLKMYGVGDSITYDMTIKNVSEEDFMIDKDTFKTDSEYIEYSLKTNDNNNVVKANSTKDVTLTVAYKKEVDDSLLTDNKFDASNNLKLSLTTSEKEKELDVITTDNIKESLDPQEVKNPITSVSSILLITCVLLTTVITAYILIKRKYKYTKYLLTLLSMILIPTVYAVCKVDIEVESTIEIEKLPKLYNTVVGLSEENQACLTKYEGDVTDEVGKTVAATNVYFDECDDKRNIKFGGFCWQVVRTTETKGTKLIYNGEPDQNGECGTSRNDHKGVVQSNNDDQTLNANYLYGSSFTYDTTNNKFTLTDTTTVKWSDTTYESLLGKFTCKTTNDECATIFQINGYKSNTEAYASSYTITNTNYNQIGTSSYNANDSSPATVGYMFNKVYNRKYVEYETTEYKFGNSFVYDENTNKYTLSGEIKTVNDNSQVVNILSNAHYTCWNTSGVCNTISYIYSYGLGSNYHTLIFFYIDIENGKSVSDALNEMLSANDVNKYNSSIKGIIDAWYAQNLLNKTSMLEDTVYCNSRDITNYGNWNPNGISDYFYDIRFVEGYQKSLACPSATNQFSISNNKAKLKYPVGLITIDEFLSYRDSSLLKSENYWTLSPCNFNGSAANYFIESYGFYEAWENVYDLGIRLTITLAPNTLVTGGTGSKTAPWLVE